MPVVITGLVPEIHVVLLSMDEDVDGRVKPGHDELLLICRCETTLICLTGRFLIPLSSPISKNISVPF